MTRRVLVVGSWADLTPRLFDRLAVDELRFFELDSTDELEIHALGGAVIRQAALPESGPRVTDALAVREGPLGLRFVRVPSGVHVCGDGRAVRIRSFWLAEFPVTNAQWQAFVTDSDYRGESDCPGDPLYLDHEGTYLGAWRGGRTGFGLPDVPVVCVSWSNAMAIATWLNESCGSRLRFVLPTECEWEHAARAGARTPFSFGNMIDTAQVNHLGSPGHPTPRGRYPANAWGLYDMHGNVFEWCANLAAPGQENLAAPVGAPGYRANRGGSYASVPQSCEAGYRHWNAPHTCHDRLGFRLAMHEAPR